MAMIPASRLPRARLNPRLKVAPAWVDSHKLISLVIILENILINRTD